VTLRCSALWLLLLVIAALPLRAETWYVRPDGGTRSRTGVPGQCDGKADAAYRGSGVNQHCAFNDFRYLYDDKGYNGISAAWVIAGGDTVIVRGCHNPGNNGECRIGGDPPGVKDSWCVGGPGMQGCSAGPIPSGTALQPTRILGEHYASCSTDNVTIRSRLTKFFGGNGLGTVVNLQNTNYVDFECIELTDHADCVQHGSPAYPHNCEQGKDDFASNGIAMNNNTRNILLQDVWIHGFTTAGIYGAVGAGINLTRVNVSFNGLAGWNFDDGRNTPDGPGASINAHYVSMIGNGCNEEYPIADSFPAISCYDSNSGGFGDSWSGQDATLAFFTCDHCVQAYNTKDGFIGPHTAVTRLTITNSESYGNMGQQWKWGATTNSTTIFENNLTVGNCSRMSAALPGAPASYNKYLSLFCRASGDIFSFFSAAKSNVVFANNTTVGYSATMFDLACQTKNTCGSAHFLFRNNIMLGFLNPKYSPGDPNVPGLFYYSDPSDTVDGDHNVYGNVRGKNCPVVGHPDLICNNPLFVNQPPLKISSESQLDNFDFHPGAGSPAIRHGINASGITVDYYGVSRPNPPSIGAVEPAPEPHATNQK
jgi:hypothetical protein